ncbi:TadE/TadG family type IV pilus assembly protein [Guyparkeria sp.]|uniref:TadE/TadG family type IV pilus assembly protein n=1 Tax=Guyparkeria sp. TaxID=2035736 RepID=UPI003970B35D
MAVDHLKDKRIPEHLPAPCRRQRGAVAVEFALVFPLLFAIFYAAVTYGFVFMLNQAMVFAAEEGARSAVRVADPARLEQEVEKVIDDRLSWMPGWAREAREVSVDGPDDEGRVTVDLEFPGSALPLAPLVLPGIGEVPRIPDLFRARADIVLSPRASP